ncbi:MAG: hypothetical protein M1813_004688 [Trichoglossum hirsutum]|nr:MAG: hypothetical protein M1813_004688 [Trichoglossum hirsutum]
MASRRATSHLTLLRQAIRTSSPLPLVAPRTICGGSARGPARVVLVQPQLQLIRHNSSSPSPKPYTFEGVSSLYNSKSDTSSAHLIDVREPPEYTSGHIPTSKNLPIISQPDALFLPGDEFFARFGWPKPGKDEEVVFYCKAGVRSAAAARLALKAGWERVGEYSGSWLEWEKKGGERET